MAYADPLDPLTPATTDEIRQGDDRIRELKRALIERLLTVFVDLDVDPLAFVAGIIPTAALADLGVTGAKIANETIDPATKLTLAAQAVLPQMFHTETIVYPAQSLAASSTVTIAGTGVGLPPGSLGIVGVPQETAGAGARLLFKAVVLDDGTTRLYVINPWPSAALTSDDMNIKVAFLRIWP